MTPREAFAALVRRPFVPLGEGCVGLGRPMEPPPTYCSSDAGCAEGERCGPVACPAVCAIPEDGGPEECFFDCPPGICMPATPPPPPPPTECMTDADCLEGQTCLLYDCACAGEPCDCGGGGFCEWLPDDPSVPPMGL